MEVNVNISKIQQNYEIKNYTNSNSKSFNRVNFLNGADTTSFTGIMSKSSTLLNKLAGFFKKNNSSLNEFSYKNILNLFENKCLNINHFNDAEKIILRVDLGNGELFKDLTNPVLKQVLNSGTVEFKFNKNGIPIEFKHNRIADIAETFCFDKKTGLLSSSHTLKYNNDPLTTGHDFVNCYYKKGKLKSSVSETVYKDKTVKQVTTEYS